MRDSENANEAIRSLNGTDLGGSVLKVNEARPRTENRGGGGGGGNYGGGSGGSGGGGGRW